MLSEDGMVAAVVTINAKEKKLVCNPTIVSKGFIFLKDNDQIIKEIQNSVVELVNKHLTFPSLQINYLKNELSKKMLEKIQATTKREPIIIPVVIFI